MDGLRLQVRSLYMWVYGGVYADLDVVTLRPIKEMFEALPANTNIVLGRDCGQRVDRSKALQSCADYDQGIPNAFMASTPGHPFWHYVLHQTIKRVWIHGLSGNLPGAEIVTGPEPLYYAFKQYNENVLARKGSSDIHVFENEIYPVSWTEHDTLDNLGCCHAKSNKTFDRACCRELFPKAYVLTFWTTMWH